MVDFDAEQFGKHLKKISDVFRELEATVLYGWPHEKYPTHQEAETIVSVFGELSLQAQTCNFSHSDRWYLAGQIVARIKRDFPNS